MAKFYGEIGFLTLSETSPGIWAEKIVRRNYYGDILGINVHWDQTDNLNDDVRTSNRVSVVFDGYLEEHLAQIRYVKWQGVRWAISSWEIARPRVVLYLKGVYNAPEIESA